MKKSAAILVLSFCAFSFASFFLLTEISCSLYSTGANPAPNPTPIPAPTNTPVPSATVGANANTYNNTTITITAGQTVLWDSSNSPNHTLYIDNGSTCLVTDNTVFPFSYTFTTAGNYNFHCSNHAGCTNSCNGSTCGGMTGTITVNP